LVNYKLFIFFSDLQKRIIKSELEFEEKQSNIFGNLNVQYFFLLNYFLISLKVNRSINFSFIFKNNNSFKNNDEANNIMENIFINRKTKRNEDKKDINQENKKKIFLIKKVKDKDKEIEMDKKIIKKTIYRKSKFRGVSRKGNLWQALIMINRKQKYIGNFKSEEEAAKAYDEYAMKFHKNKARLNFPHKGYLSI